MTIRTRSTRQGVIDFDALPTAAEPPVKVKRDVRTVLRQTMQASNFPPKPATGYDYSKCPAIIQDIGPHYEALYNAGKVAEAVVGFGQAVLDHYLPVGGLQQYRDGRTAPTRAPWKFVIDSRPTKRAGCCRYRSRECAVSAWCIRNWTWAQLLGTILHEIAHALTPGCGHGPIWKAQAIALGDDGGRCYDAEQKNPELAAKAKWAVTCVNECFKMDRVRKPKYTPFHKCNHCKGDIFVLPK